MVTACGESLIYARDLAPSKIKSDTLMAIDGGHVHRVLADECLEEKQSLATALLGALV